jgi:hypothetical protein
MATKNSKHTITEVDRQIDRVIDGSVVLDNTASQVTANEKKPVSGEGIASAIEGAMNNLKGEINTSLDKVYEGGDSVVGELSTTIPPSASWKFIDIPASARGKVLNLSIETEGEHRVYLIEDSGTEILVQGWKTGDSTLTIDTTLSSIKVRINMSSLNAGSSLYAKLEMKLPSLISVQEELTKIYGGGNSVVNEVSTTIPSSSASSRLRFIEISESARGKVLTLSIVTEGEYQVHLIEDSGTEILVQGWKTGDSTLTIDTTLSSLKIRLNTSSLNAGSSLYMKLAVELPALEDIMPLVLRHKEYYLSRANKHADFGIPTFMPYHCLQTDLSFGGVNTTTAEIYAEFDKLVESEFLTKESIGYASDGSEMFCYKRTSAAPSVQAVLATPFKENKAALEIFIVAGLHGFEKCNIFGLLYLMNDIANNSDKCPMLQYLNEMCNFIIVPCANPDGINYSKYVNKNGVNLNRNFPVRDWVADEENNTGASAADQPEVANIKSLLAKYPNASLVIDSHSRGSGAVLSNDKANWLELNYSDGYRAQMLDAACFHVRNISSIFRNKYNESTDEGPIYGYITSAYIENTTVGSLDSYAAQQGHISLTFEGFNGFTGGTVASDAVKSANAELIGNFIMAFCAKYGNLQ